MTTSPLGPNPHDPWAENFIGPYFDVTARREYLELWRDTHARLAAEDVLHFDLDGARWHAQHYAAMDDAMRRLQAYLDEKNAAFYDWMTGRG